MILSKKKNSLQKNNVFVEKKKFLLIFLEFPETYFDLVASKNQSKTQ